MSKESAKYENKQTKCMKLEQRDTSYRSKSTRIQVMIMMERQRKEMLVQNTRKAFALMSSGNTRIYS